jgi:peroxiredoxin
MKKNVLIWIAAAILVVVAVYTIKSYNPGNAKSSPPQNPQTAEPAPTAASAPKEDGSSDSGNQQENKTNLMKDYDFSLEDLNGNTVTLSDLKGKKVFLNFWATWCPPCRGEMPDIEKLYQETKDTDLVIIAVNVGEDKKTVQNFIAKNKYNFTVLLDTKGEVSQLYQVTGIPTSYFIGTGGYLNDAATGAVSYESMKEFIDKLN